MAPVGNITKEDCIQYFQFSQTTELFNISSSTTSTNSTADIAESELQALLYIVVTLLFYSLGIIIGIVTYLKREKQEMEEDKLYDEFLMMNHDPYANSKFKKVQQVIKTLEFLQKRQLTKSDCKNKLINSDSKEHAQTNSKYEMASNPKSLSFMCDKDDENNCEDDELDEPLSALVAKLIDPEKRRTLEDSSDQMSMHRGTSSCDRSNPGSPKKGGELHESSSMQSLKDYAEEPRRNERSSSSSEDDIMEKHSNVEKSQKSDGDKKDNTDCEKGNFDINKISSGSCVVTNV